MKATIKFEDGREAVIELTREQEKAVDNKPMITHEKYSIRFNNDGAFVASGWALASPLHTFKSKEHAQLLADRFNLEMEMFRWASEMNQGWVPAWGINTHPKYGLLQHSMGKPLETASRNNLNDFLFGLAFKSFDIAEQAKEIFGDRILSLYGKQF